MPRARRASRRALDSDGIPCDHHNGPDQGLPFRRPRSHRPGRRRSARPRRRGVRRHRPERRRQVHPHPLPQPPGAPHLRHGHRRRPGTDLHRRPRQARQRRTARRPQPHRDGLPTLQPAVLTHRAGQRRTAAGDPQGRPPGALPQGAGAAGPGRPRRQGQGLPRPALGRAEAARRHRPRAGRRPQGAALRRGHQRPGPGDHPLHPPVAARPQPQAGPDHRAHHARDGRRQDDLRLGRADEERPRHRAGHRRRTARHPRLRAGPGAVPGRRRALRRRPHRRRHHLPRLGRHPPGDLRAVAHLQRRHLDPRRRHGHRRRQADRPDAHRAARPLRGERRADRLPARAGASGRRGGRRPRRRSDRRRPADRPATPEPAATLQKEGAK